MRPGAAWCTRSVPHTLHCGVVSSPAVCVCEVNRPPSPRVSTPRADRPMRRLTLSAQPADIYALPVACCKGIIVASYTFETEICMLLFAPDALLYMHWIALWLDCSSPTWHGYDRVVRGSISSTQTHTQLNPWVNPTHGQLWVMVSLGL